VHLVRETCGLEADAAEQIVAYLSTGAKQLGVMPTQHDVVFERFFDEAGSMQLVVHSPFGGRVNRALGLALRKRFCVTFDFELQAAASDDAIILSLGPQHSFPLSSAARLLHPNTVKATLEQAVLASPMFTSRWRWDLSRSLAILRFRGGRKNPLPIQRMEADDVMAAVFPALAACQENTPPGPVQLPDHVIVRQVIDDCLHEAMDVDGLRELVASLHSGHIKAHFVDSVEPSVLSHEIVNSQPYTFLDGAPLEERRARQVWLRRGLPVEARDLHRLDPDAFEKVRAEVAPAPRGVEELHDLLLSALVHRPRLEWLDWFEVLRARGRAMEVEVAVGAGAGQGPGALWCSTERRRWVEALFPGARFHPDFSVPALVAGAGPERCDPDAAAALLVRGHLELTGPVTVEVVAAGCALAPSRVLVGLARLEADGFAMQGRFDPALGAGPQWCARHLLARIHSYTKDRLRRGVKPVSAQDFMRFLLLWQYVAPGARRQGRAGLLSVVQQLQGWELAAGAWEEAIFPARVEGYQRRWLEDLCLSGEVSWGRLSLRAPDGEGSSRRGSSTPSRATPVTFTLRSDLAWLMPAKRGDAAPDEPAHGPGREILDALRGRGAMFAADLPVATGRLPVEVQEGLWDLVARGIVTADGFAAVRSLFSSREVWARRHLPERRRLGLRPNLTARRPARPPGEGRWSLLGPGTVPDAGVGTREPALPKDELAEQVANQLLARWGVVFWDLAAHEDLAVPWREILWALRRFEARGVVRGGRFVNGVAGEQYALPEALDELRHVLHSERNGDLVRLCAADPLNLSGVILPGKRVPALRTNTIVLRDGLVVPAPARADTSMGTSAPA
jgi:ATP-dependent Lhr-like helicase